jgi:benzil reductase ((S)-benzoin forming)
MVTIKSLASYLQVTKEKFKLLKELWSEKMQLYIITGTSQGLGFSLAETALSQSFTVISIGRSCKIDHPDHRFIQHDLSSPDQMKEKKFHAIHLINNAAIVTPVGHLQTYDWQDISTHMHINLLLPIYLTSLLLQLTDAWDCPKIVSNISSGAAKRPIEGWALYCASKSGLKMFTDTVSETKLKTINLNPGVMDTQMQSTIREQDEVNFSRVNEFRELKDKNQLSSTDKVAGSIIKLLRAPELLDKNWYDI